MSVQSIKASLMPTKRLVGKKQALKTKRVADKFAEVIFSTPMSKIANPVKSGAVKMSSGGSGPCSDAFSIDAPVSLSC